MGPRLIVVSLACLLAGCADMTPTQKKVAWVAAGIAVTSVAISASDGDDAPATGGRKVCVVEGTVVRCHFE